MGKHCAFCGKCDTLSAEAQGSDAMEQSYEILAVDDDAAIVNILETTLTQAG